MQVTTQTTTALHEQAPIDRLVRHPHLLLLGKLPPQPVADLGGTVLGSQPVTDQPRQPRITGQLGRFGTPSPTLTAVLGHTRSIVHPRNRPTSHTGPDPILVPIPDHATMPARTAITPDLPRDRRRRTTKPIRDRTHRLPTPDTDRDLLTLSQRQSRPRPHRINHTHTRFHPTSLNEQPITSTGRQPHRHPSNRRRNPLTHQPPKLPQHHTRHTNHHNTP